MNVEENPNVKKALDPTLNPKEEIVKIDGELQLERIKLANPKTLYLDFLKARKSCNDLLDKRLEWMAMIKTVKITRDGEKKIVKKKEK